MKNVFYIVDVFAQKKYEGNQLAVFREAKSFSDSEMQRIAKEMNYSETTFILSDEARNGGYDVRIFTPAEEVPFAGHPTLGTAYVIRQEILKQPVEQIILNLKIGQIPVTFSDAVHGPGVLWMKQVQPTFDRVFEAGPVSQALGLEEKQIDDRWPVQEISTGLPFIIVPLKTLEAVKQARINRDRYTATIRNTQPIAILVFCPETYHPENDLNVRVFADDYGIPEDPATGSANGCLAAYLVRYRYRGESRIDIRVEQGYEIGRPSLLLLKAEADGEKIDVFVGGNVIPVARGEWA